MTVVGNKGQAERIQRRSKCCRKLPRGSSVADRLQKSELVFAFFTTKLVLLQYGVCDLSSDVPNPTLTLN